MTIYSLVRRLSNSTVAWSWGFNFLRLASGVLLLPLLLRLLPRPDLGMYYVFLSLAAMVVVLDLGFSPTIGRFINYAMGGAVKLAPQGLAGGQPAGPPNYPLLWELLFTARIFYRFVVLVICVLLGSFGTFTVWQKAAQTSSPGLTWLAWVVTVAAVAAETYFNVWNVFLRNINQVLVATRINVVAYVIRLGLASGLLLCGAGLASLPLASLATSFVIQVLSRRECLRALAACPRPQQVDWRAHFRTIWPNSWRLGIYFASGYLSTNANVLLCSAVFGLEDNAKYGLSLQVMNIVGGLASVWTQVKMPLFGQFIARRDIESLRRVLWRRFWLQHATYVCLALAAVALGPWLIRFIGRDKEMLPLVWMVLLMIYGLLDTHCSLWNTLISLWNELPMLWPSVATNAVGLGINLLLALLPNGAPGALVLGPLLAGAAFNYWFWPRYGARTLRLSWLGFLRYGLVRKRLAA